ncbi:30S ribosomal protein S20 [Patescibacteria group bacterium]|nr:30S ribosomal protein S20 [Patescibacteria group bacterium]MBU1895440.1 30S ribosomal protein S20 [Patescibacteria group bacterium]
MPIKASAKKELRKTKKRTAANKIIKDTYRKAIKSTIKSMEAGEKDLGEKLRLTQKALDKAAKRGVLKKNTAARKLSRLAKKIKIVK